MCVCVGGGGIKTYPKTSITDAEARGSATAVPVYLYMRAKHENFLSKESS